MYMKQCFIMSHLFILFRAFQSATGRWLCIKMIESRVIGRDYMQVLSCGAQFNKV